jgi:hypothetical protein
MNGTYTFNKSDWSGEEATIVVKNNAFEFHGYTFELEAREYDFDGKKMTDYVVHGDDWDEPVFRVCADFDGGFYCHSCGIERQGQNPFILAAQMASMTI